MLEICVDAFILLVSDSCFSLASFGDWGLGGFSGFDGVVGLGGFFGLSGAFLCDFIFNGFQLILCLLCFLPELLMDHINIR